MKIRLYLRRIINEVILYSEFIKEPIVKILRAWFPDYEEECKKMGVQKETLGMIENLDRKLRWKYFIFIILLFLFIVMFFYLGFKGFLTGLYSPHFFYYFLQEISILITFLGAIFLSKGSIKNYYQISLESINREDNNPYIIRNLIISSYNVAIGIFLITCSAVIQLTILLLSYLNFR